MPSSCRSTSGAGWICRWEGNVTHAPAFSAWLDSFFEAYYRHRPVNATFIGVHDSAELLPNYSAAGVDAALGDIEGLRAGLRSLPDEQLTQAQALDRRLAEGFLAIQQWEFSSQHFQAANPCVYSGEAAFGVLSLLRRPFAPLHERLERAAARMQAIPALLSQGQANLRAAPRAWSERALDECTGLRELLRVGVQQLMHEQNCELAQVHAAAERAVTAVDSFASFVQDLPPSEEYACGAEAFDLYLRQGHFLTQGADEIARYAQVQFD